MSAARLLALAALAGSACATAPVLDPGCTLTPVIVPATPAPAAAEGKAPPGTCFPDSVGAATGRVVPEGVAGCSGALGAGQVPLKLPPPYTCVATKMTPEVCAASCLAANSLTSIGGVAVIGLEFSTECYCGATWPIEKGGKPEPIPKVAPATDCAMPCSADPAQKCGGTNFVEVWKVDCGIYSTQYTYTPSNSFKLPLVLGLFLTKSSVFSGVGSNWGWVFLISLVSCSAFYGAHFRIFCI